MPVHNINPIYDAQSEILILGSFPSVKSREGQFFYDHPQNRFWKVLAAVLGTSVPQSHAEKSAFLRAHHIALWDVLAACEIQGSADSSITAAKPNDLAPILQAAKIKAVFCNGAAAFRYYDTYTFPKTGMEAVKLPSTSPANAAFSLEKLCTEWQAILRFLTP